jgi:hypothetical protein
MHMSRSIRFLILMLLASAATEKIVQAASPIMQPLANNPNCAIYNMNPQAKETITWTGPCKNGLAHGQGTETWMYYRIGERKKETYVGEMQAGKRRGRGGIGWSGGSPMTGIGRTVFAMEMACIPGLAQINTRAAQNTKVAGRKVKSMAKVFLYIGMATKFTVSSETMNPSPLNAISRPQIRGKPACAKETASYT